MKRSLFLTRIICLAATLLFATGLDSHAAGTPTIVMDDIPPIGSGGHAEGRIVWDNLSAKNAQQYAVIAMLNTKYGDFAKPTFDNYLSAIDESGNFSIPITTDDAHHDYAVPDVAFYFVQRDTFRGIPGNQIRTATMQGKHLGRALTVNRRDFWANRPPAPTANIRPGFVAAGTKITLSWKAGATIRYTLDGSDPVSSPTALPYSASTQFVVPARRPLLIKAVTIAAGTKSATESFLWMPQEPFATPFFGLNVSLALNGENFGQPLSEAATRKRMEPIAKYTKWLRTFGTINNGHPHINKIAKEKGMKTMIGLYITRSAAANEAQIEGLRKILQTGPAPDLIAVGNECSLIGVSPVTLASCIDAVRVILKENNLVIPIGSVDIANITWSHMVAKRLDFIGINAYPGTWDATPENKMVAALKQTYANALAAFPSKFVFITETGTPYAGGTYKPLGANVPQTPSPAKTAKYLQAFLEWHKKENIPAFYFEAYNERCKSANGGHPIEQYFGIMDGNGKEHPWVRGADAKERENHR